MIGEEDEARLQRRVGTTVGLATLLTLTVYPFLLVDAGQADRLDLVRYLVIVGVGSASALVVASSPVMRSLPRHRRARAAHAWTAVLLATVTGAIAFSGGSVSELHHLLALPLVFAAMAYPRRILVVLLVLTVALVALVQVVTASPFLPARTVTRVATVGGSVLVTSWLTAAHARQLRRTRRARDEADRQAEALHALARSASEVNDLDHEAVLDAVVTAAVRIGYDGAAFLVLRQGGIVVAEHAGTLTPERVGALVPEEELRACLADQTTRSLVVDGTTLQCAPVVIDRRTVGALVGAAPDEGLDGDGVGLRILGAQAATALTNAHRFRSTQELVDRLRDVERFRHDLVSTASHELRTPTTVIKAAAELLDARWSELDETQRRRFVQRLNVHVGALEHVLDQLAMFVDLDTGSALRLDRATLDLAELVRTSLARYEHLLADRTVVTRLAPVEVTADAEALGRAVNAVLDNVVTHTPPGTTMEVVTEETDAAARLAVTDDGDGVPDEVLPTLLAPFARSGDVLTRGTRGVGLGLTFVDHTVRAHGGTVVLSTDAGFTVGIQLPTAVASPAAAASTQLGSEPEPDREQPLALIVEDDDSLRNLATITLRDAGCAVRATADGRSALTVAAAQRPDVVVLDVDLPGLDGREVARVLRDDPATADVPIVVVTGSADRQELWTIWASGADALLTKPYDVEELASTVLDMVGAGDTDGSDHEDHADDERPPRPDLGIAQA